MKESPIDFGLGIAYVVPGMVLAYALSPFYAPLHTLIAAIANGEQVAGPSLLLLVVATVFGMLISVLRGSTIDRTFSLGLRRWRLLSFLPHHYEPILNSGVNLGGLATEGLMKAFLEIRSSFHRKYQFYGNVLLALCILVISRCPIWSPRHSWARFALELLAVCLFAPFLYSACRVTFFQLAEANARLQAAVDRSA